MHLGTRSLTVTIDGVPRTADISDCRIVSNTVPNEIDLMTGPVREYRLQGIAAQDPTPGSLWDLAWSNPGAEVEVVLRPAGGVTASPDQPAFVGTVKIEEADGDMLGGRADPSTGNRFVFEVNWRFTAKPTRVVA